MLPGPAQPNPLFPRRWAGLSLMILGLLGGIWIGLGGCSSPQQRYKTLSFFFDGVPDPDARKAATQQGATGPVVITASIVSRHKPFVEAKCDTCHRSSSGNIMEFEEAYKVCTQCHTTIINRLPRMHGPVARGDCKWCHTPHESTEPHLLKDIPVKVCTQCHDAQLLGSKPAQHNDGQTSCLQCHFGHGGTARYFLKPDANPQWPSTQPATQPATNPTTQPTTAPAPSIENRKSKIENLPGAP